MTPPKPSGLPMIVLGTRPEIVKMSPVIQHLVDRGEPFTIVHSGQHYSKDMDEVFFQELGLPAPDMNLKVGSGPHGRQTGRMLELLEGIMQEEQPRWVLVQGDTNTVLAGVLAAAKIPIMTGHVEAGLRSGDRSMPEELNRIVADHLADALFAPTAVAAHTLSQEGVPAEKIHVVGNTVVDALRRNKDRAGTGRSVLDRLGLSRQGFVLATVHRQENVDSATRFQSILDALNLVAAERGLPVVYPIHPRARARIEAGNLRPGSVQLIDPVGYLEFLSLQDNAALIMTDSGGIQEEACILGVPCVTLRDSTERPETVTVGANRLSGFGRSDILHAFDAAAAAPRAWQQPYGDGRAAERIVEIMEAPK